MKKLYISALIIAITLGTASFARAENFVVDHDMYKKHQQTKVQTTTRYDARTSDFQKGMYSGSSGYTGGLTGQVAVRDSMNDGDDKAFVVRPVRGKGHEFGTTFRYGDMSQSREARLNHSFNN